MINQNIFEITGDDIAKLNDADLRDLIGMLCEADYRSAGLNLSGIRYGGHQDAKDGGIDVIVENDFLPPENSFVPRRITIFQVKKPKMPRKKIMIEMKPNGVLRTEIRNLIQQNGAYIIASSGDSVSETAYTHRVKAMKEATADEENFEELHVDFFDQKQITSWVRTHPSMIFWVRRRIGREIQGWQPYGNWSRAPGGIEEDYILDENTRLFDSTTPTLGGLTTEEGLSILRQKLSKPRTSIRLTGLSGVGKTRFAQALFDARIGQDALNQSLAIYTDISDSPLPNSKTLGRQLNLSSERVILIVDNCPPVLHRKLNEICTADKSKISLLTIEYDIRDDTPEETEVFRLESASDSVVMKIITNRYPFISQVDVRTIAGFSGGNARIALALANTLNRGDSLSNLRDDQLFERLFWQRHEREKTLLHTAEVFSLLYSFEGTETGPGSELHLLGSLIDRSADQLYRHIGVLKNRSLLQARSTWRAVLPHAIANRLAKNALLSIPKNKIVSTIIDSDNERMIKSFTHRLSYLHDSEIAVEIVSDWLSQDGWIGKQIFDLDDLGIQVLQNSAPVCPDQTLILLEKSANHQTRGKWFTSRDNPKYVHIVKILRNLAYEADTFHRSATLLAKYAISENEGENNNPIREYFKALFFRTWSGTLASQEVRHTFIEDLLSSDKSDVQKIGLLALEGSLKARRFFPPPEHSFGARMRDIGFKLSIIDALPWYEDFVNLCTSHILSDKPTAHKAKKVLAKKLRELWVIVKAYKVVENSVKKIRKNQSWNEAWIHTNEILQFDKNRMSPDGIKRIKVLREVLKPQDLQNLIRSYALSSKHLFTDLESEFNDDAQNSSDNLKLLLKRTMQIGSMLAHDENVLNALLPELVSENNFQVYTLGRGLVKGSTNIRKLWEKIRSDFINTPKEKRRTVFLRGFLFQCAKDAANIYNEILDDITCDEILGDLYPVFESSAPIDLPGLERLYRSLENNICEMDKYAHIAYNGAHTGMGDNDLADLIEEILKKKNGFKPAAQILTIRFTNKKDPSLHSDKLLRIARKNLLEYKYSGLDKQKHLDHTLTSIAEVCLEAEYHKHIVKNICTNIRYALSKNYISWVTMEAYMGLLLKNYPEIFLESFLENSEDEEVNYFMNFHSMFYEEVNPLSKVSDDILINWCKKDPDNRFELLSDIIQPYTKSEDATKLLWRDVVYYIFANVQELEQIFENISISIRPSG